MHIKCDDYLSHNFFFFHPLFDFLDTIISTNNIIHIKIISQHNIISIKCNQTIRTFSVPEYSFQFHIP